MHRRRLHLDDLDELLAPSPRGIRYDVSLGLEGVAGWDLLGGGVVPHNLAAGGIAKIGGGHVTALTHVVYPPLGRR